MIQVPLIAFIIINIFAVCFTILVFGTIFNWLLELAVKARTKAAKKKLTAREKFLKELKDDRKDTDAIIPLEDK